MRREPVAIEDLLPHELRDREYAAIVPARVARALDPRDHALMRTRAAQPAAPRRRDRAVDRPALEVGEASAAVEIHVLPRRLAEAVHEIEGSRGGHGALARTVEPPDLERAHGAQRIRDAVHGDPLIDARVGALAEEVHLVAGVEQRLCHAMRLPLDAADVARVRVGERYPHRAPSRAPCSAGARRSISVAASGARGASG